MQYIIPPKAEGQKADPGKVMFSSHRYYQYFSGRFVLLLCREKLLPGQVFNLQLIRRDFKKKDALSIIRIYWKACIVLINSAS